MDTGGGLFADALPFFDDLGEPAGAFFGTTLEELLDDVLFVAAAGAVHPIAALLHLVALVQQQRGVAAVVHDQFRAFAAGMRQRGQRVVPVFLERFPFEGEDGNARLGNRRGGLVLGAEDVAACPAHRGAQLDQRLDQHGRLDRHVQRAGHPHAFQGLLGAVLLADGHQAGHFLLGHGDFLAAPIGEAEVFDLVIARRAAFAVGRRGLLAIGLGQSGHDAW